MGKQCGDAVMRRIIEGEPRGRDPRLVHQCLSPLGAERHRAAVLRRLQEVLRGERAIAGASVEGRSHWLTQEALAEEMGRVEAPEGSAISPPVTPPFTPEGGAP